MRLKRFSINKKGLLQILVVSLILTCFFIINFAIIPRKAIFIDEAVSYFISTKLSYATILSGIDTHPPTYYLLIKVLCGGSFFLMRLLSLLFMLSGMIVLYNTLKKHFSFEFALMSVMIMSFSTTLSHYAIEARMYALLFFLSSFLLYYILEKKFAKAYIMIIVMFLVHYYSFFLFIPLFGMMFLCGKEQYRERVKRILLYVVYFLFVLLLFSSCINHQIHNNPYKLIPPVDKSSISSMMSMIMFPFIIPSLVHGYGMYFCAMIVLLLVVYLIASCKTTYKHNSLYVFSIISFCTAVVMVVASIFVKFPYHHRYTIMFFPFIYFLIVSSIKQKKERVGAIAFIVLIVFLVMTSLQYHRNPPSELYDFSKRILCPQNILHETPFSMLPIMMYLPNCNHYIGLTEDFSYIMPETVYSTKDKINNQDVDYDIYIQNFNEPLLRELLVNSTNPKFIRIP